MSSAVSTSASFATAVAPRPWLARVLRAAAARPGVHAALFWLLAVGFCAVFAPLLANSYPIVVKMDGRWSSPMLAHLTRADVALLGFTFIAVLLVLLRRAMPRRALVATAGGLSAAVLLAAALVRPPAVHVYDEYRRAEALGRVQFILRAPVPYSPSDYLRDRWNPARPHPQPPSRQHPLGTDRNGGDILSRMIHACRLAMSIGFVSTGIALVVGTFIGGLMGYFARWVDLIGMRLVEIFSAMPTTYLLLACVAFLKPLVRSETAMVYLFMVIIGLTGWVGYARFTRAEFLKLRSQDFVYAAIAAGLPMRSVLFRHILPNAVGPLLVGATFGIAGAILSESMISFLGLGLVDAPSWGQLLSGAVTAFGFRWWLALFPGMAIFLTLFAYNLIGEALRDAIDPRLWRAMR